MLGNCRNEFKGCKHLKIPFITAMAHLRTVDNRTCLLDITQLGQRKGVADDVLGDILDALGVSRLKPHLVMDTESGVVPPGKDLLYQGIVKTAFVFQHLQNRSTRELGKRLKNNFRHHIKIPALGEESIRHQSMDMRMPLVA
jgi:hypothetical protein